MTGCAALVPADSVLCDVTADGRAGLTAALTAHPETPKLVGEYAVDVLVEMSVCPS